MQSLVDEFKTKYDYVFDENGNIKVCGRMYTYELMDIAVQIDPNTDFGNMKTGFMNVDNIKKLYDSLK